MPSGPAPAQGAWDLSSLPPALRPRATVPAPNQRVLRLGDLRLRLGAEEAGLLEPVVRVLGECAGVPDGDAAPAEVCCTLARTGRASHLLLAFEGARLPDLARVALAVLHPPRDQPRYEIGARREDGWQLVGGRDRPVAATDGSRLVVDTGRVRDDFVAELLTGVAFALQEPLLVLHGAALAIGGRGALLTGASHAGKTTTAAHLASRGHGLLGDELAALRLSSRELVPVPRAMTLRPGPREPELARLLASCPGAAPEPSIGPSGPHRIDRIFGTGPARPVRLEALFVLSGFAEEPRAEPFTPRLAHSEIFEYLVANDVALISWGLTSERHVLRLMALHRTLESVHCWRLTVGRPAATAGLIELTMESR